MKELSETEDDTHKLLDQHESVDGHEYKQNEQNIRDNVRELLKNTIRYRLTETICPVIDAAFAYLQKCNELDAFSLNRKIQSLEHKSTFVNRVKTKLIASHKLNYWIKELDITMQLFIANEVYVQKNYRCLAK